MATHRLAITTSGTTGGAGTSTANATSDEVINGRITAIHLAYLGSPPASTTDVTIEEVGNAVTKAILTVTDGATDGWRYIMAQAVNQLGASITNQGTPIHVNGKIKVTIAGANDADGVTATIEYE
jgi:hypothetical protein